MKTMMNFLAGAAMVLLPLFAVADATPPDVLVKNTANDVLAIIKSDKDIQAGDMRKITALAEEKILPQFDFNRMSRMVLGKYWAGATPDQQKQFVDQFRSLLIRTYASALSKYRDQTIDYKPLRADPGATDVTVKTQINQPGGQPIPLDYSLIKNPDGWKVYDVVIEGLSLVTSYSGQFGPIAKQGGMDEMIRKLAEKDNQ
ncbi:MAG TPA: ABC transporter substrate-binding protein, partial [Methylophilaceae bacterium]|nr:ABC transporter substrate-binding protein [Methylophilaceae bacterium]